MAKLKDGTEVERLKTIASARKAIRDGHQLLVFGAIERSLYLRHPVTTEAELELAKQETTGKQVSNLCHKTKPAYFKIVKAV